MKIIKRNIPIFLIGGLTTLIFVGVIIASQKTPPTGPRLTEINEKELIAGHTYVYGNSNAPLTLVEFSDFECPACGLFAPTVKKLRETYPNYLRVVYRHLPLPQHPYARNAAIAAQVAGEQGKFWEYHDIIFENQQNLLEEDLYKYAEQLNLDMEKFRSDFNNGSFGTLIGDDIKAANKFGVSSTPTFFLNGIPLSPVSPENLEETIMVELDKYIAKPTQQRTSPIEQLDKVSPDEVIVESSLPILEVTYTKEKGFIPREPQAWLGQTVKWTNNSESEIKLIQKINKFDEFNNGVTIQPGESFELVLTDDKLWTYTEEVTEAYGSIFIKVPKN